MCALVVSKKKSPAYDESGGDMTADLQYEKTIVIESIVLSSLLGG